jgi:hypothetical protein
LENSSEINSLGERLALQVTELVGRIVAPYVEPPSDKALGESLGEARL